ncbi:GNAT family N-acetyltransferase [Jiulongibacter sp. NS-SX5]|uniref:GNAT family N-acetyltransferase n=1 Tax=Jiulongibacter sp. NS-SX5 TaxID=3463854 RepID=UPI0040585490
MEIIRIKTTSEWYPKELELRDRVLRRPIGLSISDDDLSDEPNQIHIVAIEDDKLIGVVLLKIENSIGKLRQMAVSEEAQGKQLGTKLVSALEEYARENNVKEIKLHARHYAVGFYEKLGYTKTSKPPFEEVGMEHFEMEHKLQV